MDYGHVAADYLKFIGLPTARPNEVWLSRLARSFHRMPYENLTKIIKYFQTTDAEKRLRTPDIVLADHMEYGTGGTCFSLTHFYRQVLENAGYDLYTVLCDRSYGADTHCAMIVRLCGKRYLVDPGYLLEAPLLVPEREESVQSSKSSTVKLRRLGDTNQLLLITERGGKAKIRYRLKDVPVTDELYHKKWIESFEWPMMRHMSVSRQTEDGLLFMRDGKMRLYEADGDRRAIIKGDLSGELKRHFGIDPRIASDAGDCVKMFKGSYGK